LQVQQEGSNLENMIETRFIITEKFYFLRMVFHRSIHFMIVKTKVETPIARPKYSLTCPTLIVASPPTAPINGVKPNLSKMFICNKANQKIKFQ
jgi:hypothetical protein